MGVRGIAGRYCQLRTIRNNRGRIRGIATSLVSTKALSLAAHANCKIIFRPRKRRGVRRLCARMQLCVYIYIVLVCAAAIII